MHKFRGSSCLSHTSQSDDVFNLIYHLSKLWSICSCSKCLVICSKTLHYFLTSTYVPNQKVQLSPTEISYPEPPSSVDIATARNPNQFRLTDGISVSPRWACKLSVAYCINFGPTEICNRPPRVCWANSLFCLLPKSVPPSLCNRSNRDEVLP